MKLYLSNFAKNMDVDSMLNQAAQASADALRLVYLRRYKGGGSLYRSIQAKRNQVEANIAVATLISGRRPGKFPPWGYQQGTNNKTALMQWAMDKFQVDEKAAKSISYLVARKLKLYGSDVWRGLKPKLEADEARQAGVMRMQQLILDNHREKINLVH